MKTLIMGVALNYSFDDIKIFLVSLSNTGYSGDIVLFFNKVDSVTLKEIKKYNVKVRFFNMRGNGLINSWGRFWSTLKLFIKLPIGRKWRSYILQKMTHFMYLRFFLYDDFLGICDQKYDLILLSDLRDVYFQRDPFSGIFLDKHQLIFFQENPDIKLQDCSMNREWLVNILGEKALKKIGEMPIICAGTVMGSHDGVKEFLDMFIDYHKHIQYLHPNGDQALVNYIAYNLLPKETIQIYPNNSGPILTMSSLSNESITIDLEERVLDINGEVVPILHQYDRHPKIKEAILKKVKSTCQ